MSERVVERQLPYDGDAERALLGAVLVNNDYVTGLAGEVEADDFYLEGHRQLWRAMVEMIGDARVVDLVTIQDALKGKGQLETVGGIAYVAGLMEGMPHLVNVGPYVEILKKKSTLRKLIHAANVVMVDCFDETEEVAAIVEKAARVILEVGQDRDPGGFVATADLQAPTMAAIERLYHEREAVTGISTGFTELDRMTSGFQKGDLVLLAARPAVGKTSCGLNIMAHVAMRRRQTVGMFSLEMATSQLMLRLLCAEAMVDAHKLRTGYLGREDLDRLREANVAVGRAPMYIDDVSQLTVLAMRGKAKRLQQEHGLDLLIIDYLQLMSGAGRIESRQQEVAAIARGLKGLAKELDIPILALAQLSRAPEQRKGDHKPQLSDLRETGELEQSADTVLMLFREEMYAPSEENDGLAEVIIAKQRNGPTGSAKLAFLKNFTKFENLLSEY